MNRRDALKSLLTIPLLGAWRVQPAPRPIDLSTFVADREGYYRYELRYPFEQEGWLYATDAKICVRTLHAVNDVRSGDEFRFPKACGLNWDHDHLPSWVKMPKQPEIVFREDYCPTCDGTGRNPHTICDECQGYSEEWNFDYRRKYRKCKCKCKGTGYLGPVCLGCDGTPYGNFPTGVKFGNHLIHRKLWDKLYTLRDVEITPMQPINEDKTKNPIRFRFDGGTGLLMPLSH